MEIGNYSDLLNGMFELVAGMFVILNIKQLNKDKEVKGISPISVIFFTMWGFWNVIFYPMNGFIWSFIGGLFIFVLNVFWVIQILYYKKNPRGSDKNIVNSTGEGKLYIKTYDFFMQKKIKKTTKEMVELFNDKTETKTSYYLCGGKKFEVPLVDGKIHGTKTLWYENGNKRYEVLYVNDKIHGTKTLWWENGNKRHEVLYVNDKKHGLQILWHKSGNKNMQTQFVDGKLNGLEISWYENGTKQWWVKNVDGKYVGLRKFWHDDGSRDCDMTYKKGISHGIRIDFIY